MGSIDQYRPNLMVIANTATQPSYYSALIPMPVITLPDGSQRSFDSTTTPLAVAADISPNLAKASMGARIDGTLCEVNTPIEEDAKIELVTLPRGKAPPSDDLLYLIRHSCAHVMAEAIEKLYPGVQLVYGPPLDNGFYYDISVPPEITISSDDFEKIEKEMAKIIAEDRPFTRVEMSVDTGIEKLTGEKNKFKLDNAQRAIEAGSDELTWYVTGKPDQNWEDLCRGPHVPTTGAIGAFKIMSLASSYWKGDANSDKLTRVYGTAFATQKQLEAHLEMLEAKRRDHRVLGRQLGLFQIDEMVGQGLVLWTPKGAVIRNELQRFIGEELRRQGYQEVFTPHIGKLDLYRTSGHFPYYQDSQYPPLIDQEQLEQLAEEGCSCAELANRMRDGDIDGYLLKPMNCPHHIRIFAGEPRSYRDLPLRLNEFGTVYRWEQSGELGGMTRVRGFTQDDAHLFCTEEQVAEEVAGCLEIVKIIFATLDMTDYRVRVGLRDPDSDKYVGEPANWEKAEQACREAAASLGVPFSEEFGEAAFYGPKIDFVVSDVIGRQWQLGTIQVDYNLPARFDLSYIGADNAKHRPVMIHRAPFGSWERFIGVLIEHFAGSFPTWLSPEQVRVLPISDKSSEYAQAIYAALKNHGVRVTIDESAERIQAKIRNGIDKRIPYLLIVGPRDQAAGTVSVRVRGQQGDLGSIPSETFLTNIKKEIESRGQSDVISSCFSKASESD
jgi:threonyl-tRNA synthetase